MQSDSGMVKGGAGVYGQGAYPQLQAPVQTKLPPGFEEEMMKRASAKKGGVGAIGGASRGSEIGPASLAIGAPQSPPQGLMGSMADKLRGWMK